MARLTTSRPDNEPALATVPAHELRALAGFLIDLYRADSNFVLATLSANRIGVSGQIDSDTASALLDDRLAAQAEALEDIGFSHAQAHRAVLANHRCQTEAAL